MKLWSGIHYLPSTVRAIPRLVGIGRDLIIDYDYLTGDLEMLDGLPPPLKTIIGGLAAEGTICMGTVGVTG